MEAVFDPALSVTGWFDPTLDVEGWFDEEFTADTGSGQTVAVGTFSETDSLGPVTMRDQAWVAAVGAENSGTGNVTYTLPAHQADDILLLLIECAESAGVTAPSGWAHITNSPRAQGSNVTTVNVLWKRATSSAETNPTVTDPGNHQVGFAVAIRGADTTGDPWDFTPVGDGGAGATSFSADNGTTTVTRTLICSVVVANTDTLTDQFSSVSMTGVSNFTEQGQAFTDNGNGGGVALYTATRNTAGTPGPCDGTIGTSSTWSALTFAITKAVSGQTVAVGGFTETDALSPVGKAKTRTVGSLAEVDALTAAGRAKTRTVGTFAETDAIGPVSVDESNIIAVGSFAETDALTAITRRKSKAVGTLAETGALGALASRKSRTVGAFAEADAWTGITERKSRTVGTWSETDALGAVAKRKSRTVSVLLETDALTGVARAKRRTVGTWAETDALTAVTRRKTVTVGGFTEVDALSPLPKVVAVGGFAEIDLLGPVGRIRTRLVGAWAETDTLAPVGKRKNRPLGTLAEFDALTGVTVVVPLWLFTPPGSGTFNGYPRGSKPANRLFGRVSGQDIHYCVLIFDIDTTPRLVVTRRPNTAQMEAADHVYLGPREYTVRKPEHDILVTRFPDDLVPA